MAFPRSSLLSLPIELLERILLISSIEDVVTCTRVCRSLRALIKGSLQLEYKQECHIARVQDGGPRCGVPLRDRLQGLRLSRRAWRTLKYSCESKIRQTEGAMEIFGSLYMQRSADCMGVVFYELPSPSRRIDGHKSWPLPQVDSPFIDFTYDAAQDLLVTVGKQSNTTYLHTLCGATGKQHPKAASSSVSFSHVNRTYDDSDVRVHEGLLGFITSEGDFYNQEFYVWDWRTSELLVHLYQREITWPLPKVYFTIWDDRHILVPIPEPLADGAQLAVIDCYERRGLRGSFQEALRTASLSLTLPRLGPLAYYDLIDICRDTSTLSPKHEREGVSFYPDHHARLIAVTIYVDAQAEHTREYRLIMPWDAIDRRLHGHKRVIPWSRWSHDARLLSCPLSPVSQPPLFGACAGRYALSERVGDQSVVVVYDFASPQALRIDMAEGDPLEKVQYVMEKTDLEDSKIWADKLETALPYRRIVSDIVLDQDEFVMISEDCLLVYSRDEKKPIRILAF